MKENKIVEAPREYYKKSAEYIKAMGREVSDKPEENLDLFPIRGWFSNKNYEKKIEILSEAINKKCLITKTKGYADIVEGVRIIDNKDNKITLDSKYLPIGTVVMLKDGRKRVMIIGFGAVQANNKNKIWDYTGCLYPEGFLAANKICMFDNEQIAQVHYLGLAEDEEEKAFKQKLNEISNLIKKEKTD